MILSKTTNYVAQTTTYLVKDTITVSVENVHQTSCLRITNAAEVWTANATLPNIVLGLAENAHTTIGNQTVCNAAIHSLKQLVNLTIHALKAIVSTITLPLELNAVPRLNLATYQKLVMVRVQPVPMILWPTV